ncbi:MAG: homoserine dehydrogenase [Chloroflexi bacterium]|nr:homoserine dehydrogenase [Chloroflexota bacterium]
MGEIHQIPVILVGLGNVGSVLLRQILETRDVLARRRRQHMVPVGIADISGALVDADGLPDSTLSEVLDVVTRGQLLDALPDVAPVNALHPLLQPGTVLVDITASTSTRTLISAAMDAGCGIVLANKNPLAGPWVETQPLLEYPALRYEVTVGAGLPVIETLEYLLDTGDRVTRIDGCVSGTLGFLCARIESGATYSQAIADARSAGYTEPDPREDLSGRDVARKALIMARTVGWPLEQTNLVVEELYPAELAEVTTDEFMARADSQNHVYADRFTQARSRDQTLRYVARVTPDSVVIGLTPVDLASPLGALRGPGNYIAIYTHRYTDLPLVLSGPGAGPEVTAAGVLGDIIKLGAELGVAA